MENGEIPAEIFDLKPIFPEIFSSSGIEPQDLDTRRKSSSPEIKMQLKNSPITRKTNPAALISFENSNTAADKMDLISFSSSASSNDVNSSKGANPKRISASTARTPSQALDHVMAERKRRENLSQLFISLSRAVPGLKKLDKASILDDGIKYLKSLEERIRVLEEEEERRSAREAAAKEEKSSYDSEPESPEIQARISDKYVLIKILCKKEMGLTTRIPSEIVEKMHLNVLDMRIMPFGGEALDISILAEMVGELEESVKGIEERLHTLLFNFNANR